MQQQISYPIQSVVAEFKFKANVNLIDLKNKVFELLNKRNDQQPHQQMLEVLKYLESNSDKIERQKGELLTTIPDFIKSGSWRSNEKEFRSLLLDLFTVLFVPDSMKLSFRKYIETTFAPTNTKFILVPWSWPLFPQIYGAKYVSQKYHKVYISKIISLVDEWIFEEADIARLSLSTINSNSLELEGALDASVSEDERILKGKLVPFNQTVEIEGDFDIDDITSNFDDFQRVIDEMRELVEKFNLTIQTCSDLSVKERIQSTMAEGTWNWLDNFKKEFEDIQMDYVDALTKLVRFEKKKVSSFQIAINNNNSSRELVLTDQEKEKLIDEISTQLVDSKALLIERRLKLLVKRLEKHCPPPSRDWGIPSFTLPPIEFKFTRDGIPKGINDWLAKPLKKKQNSKAVVEIILTNGGECPEFSVGDTIIGGWEVKVVEYSGFRNTKLQAGEIFLKRGISMTSDDAGDNILSSLGLKSIGEPSSNSLSNIYGFDPNAIIGSSFDIETIKKYYDIAREGLEPLAAEYLQNIQKCRLFLGIQKPSPDDEDDVQSSRGINSIGEPTAVKEGLTSSLVQVVKEIGRGFGTIAQGLASIARMEFLRGIQQIMYGIGQITYSTIVRLVFQTGLRKLVGWMWKHPMITGFLFTAGVVVAPVIITSAMGIGLGSIVIPPETGATWFIVTRVFQQVLNTIQVAPSVLSSLFFQLSGWVKFMTGMVCGNSMPSNVMRTIIKYYLLKDFIQGISKRSSGSKLSSTAIWFYDSIFGKFFDYLFTLACSADITSWLNWAWNQSSSISNAISSQIDNNSNTIFKNLPREYILKETPAGASKYGQGITEFTELYRNADKTILQSADGADIVSTSTRDMNKYFYYTNGVGAQSKAIGNQVSTYLRNSFDVPESLSSSPRSGFVRWSDADFSHLNITSSSLINEGSRLQDKIITFGVGEKIVDISNDPVFALADKILKKSITKEKLIFDPITPEELARLSSDISNKLRPNIPRFNEQINNIVKKEIDGKGVGYMEGLSNFAQSLLEKANDYRLSHQERLDEMDKLMGSAKVFGYDVPISKGISSMAADLGFESAFSNFAVSANIITSLPALQFVSPSFS